MKKKLCRALGLLLSFTMLSTDLGSIAVSAADNDGKVIAEAGSSDEVAASEENADETVSGDAVSGNEAVSDNETDGETASENEADKEEDSASENEAVSENEADGQDDTDDVNDPTYKILDESLFKLKECNIDAGSYSATAEIKGICGDNDYYRLAVIYTTKENAEFFPDKEYITENELNDAADYMYTGDQSCNKSVYLNGEDVYYYYIDLIPWDDQKAILSPNTTYTYQVVSCHYVIDEWGVYDRSDYYFLGAPASFTTGDVITESQIKVKEIKAAEKGYYREEVEVTLDVPANEKNGSVGIFEKGTDKTEAIETLRYDRDEDVYRGSFWKSSKELELRINVHTGQDEPGYVKADLPQDMYSDKDAVFSVSFNGSQMNLIATGKFTPYYEIDDLSAYFYYRKSTESYWNSSSTELRYDGAIYAMMSGGALDPDSEYQYYFELAYYDYNTWQLVTVRSVGSEDEPMTFKTGAAKTYTKEDFKDEAFYNYLKDQFGEDGLTNSNLEGCTGFNIYTYSNLKYAMKSLEDIPVVLPNLITLRINSQDITDISPLLNMKYLETVDLNSNDISELPDLSAVKWTGLSLYNNPITEEAIDKAKAPAGLYVGWSHRADILNTSDIYYIDAKGVYPILIEYRGMKDGRKYSASISINGIEKTYDSWYGNMMTITTAKDDFNLEKDKDYTAKIVINDGFTNVFEAERSFRIEELPEENNDIYGTSGYNSVKAMVYFTKGEYTGYSFSSLQVKRDDKVYYSSTSVYVYDTDRRYDLYKDNFENTYSIKGLDYDASYINCNPSMVRVPEGGDYDLVLNPKEGEPLVWKNKVHITSEAVVTNVSYDLDYLDNAGSYYYIRLGGYNLNEKDVYPVITDKNGVEYTKVAVMDITYDKEAVYKLEKKENWQDINKADDNEYYYITLKGNKFTDKTSMGAKKIKASSLKKKDSVNLRPVKSYYNWKNRTFEFVFDSTVKKGTKLNFTFYNDNDRKVKKASAEAEIGDSGILSVRPLTAEDTVFIPGKEEGKTGENFDQLLDISDGESIAKTSVWVEWFNWSGSSSPSEDYFSICLSKTYLPAPAKEIEISVRASASKHKTNELYAKIYGTDEKKDFIYRKDGDADTFTFDGKWELKKALEAGVYTIMVCEKINGKEVELDTARIYVRDKDKFYANYISGSLKRDDLTKASVEIDMPYADVPDSEKEADLQKVVDDLKLKIEVFDADYNPVKNIKYTPYRGVSSCGGLYFDLTGLDKDEYMYYVRITADGKTPLNPDTDKEYYGDPEYGKAMKRSSSFGVYSSEDYNAYYCLYTSELKNQPPFKLNFYSLSSLDKLITSVTVKKGDIDKNGYYYFSKKDVEKLDPNAVYNCVVIANNKRVYTYVGYFASKDGAAAYNPEKITLKVNKKENITATLVLNTNGADPVSEFYKIAKNGKSAKMTKLTKRGYTFNGWYVTYVTAKGAEKQKKITTINAKIIKKYAPEGTLTLDAKFTPNKYSISYKKTAPAKKVKVKGKIKLLKEEKKLSFEGGMVTAHGMELTADGYKLIGWSTVKNGDMVIKVGDTKPVSELIPDKGKKITFYPVWEADKTAE